jgi:hypothetical protein
MKDRDMQYKTQEAKYLEKSMSGIFDGREIENAELSDGDASLHMLASFSRRSLQLFSSHLGEPVPKLRQGLLRMRHQGPTDLLHQRRP